VQRALALREEAGTLTGHAIGEEPEDGPEARVTVLVDVLGVWPMDRSKASSQWLAKELGSKGGRYLDWQGPDLTRALTARGVRKPPGGVWVDEGEGNKNLQGFFRRTSRAPCAHSRSWLVARSLRPWKAPGTPDEATRRGLC
jgi:S-DNA-T family DNA segregation ATPase FtsK/SpoIIIE